MPITAADLDAQLDKIRKVLALAEGATTEGEAEAATRKAEILMAKYGIDRAMVSHTDPGSDPLEWQTITLQAPYAVQKACLLHTVAAAYNGQTIRRPGAAAGANQVVEVCAHKSDLERIDILFTSLLLQIATGINRRVPAHGARAAAYRRSYILGFNQAVRDRLREAAARARQESGDTTGTDLVLADRSALVRNAFTDRWPNVRFTTVTSGGGGYGAGRAAGAAADLGGARVTRGRQHAIGGR